MIKYSNCRKLALMAIITFFCFQTFSQAIIKVTVVSVQTGSNEDCDGFLQGESDFVWEYTATDNTIGYTNNNPALFGVYDFNYTNIDNDNGPYNTTVNALLKTLKQGPQKLSSLKIRNPPTILGIFTPTTIRNDFLIEF